MAGWFLGGDVFILFHQLPLAAMFLEAFSPSVEEERDAGSLSALTFEPGDVHRKGPGEQRQRDRRHDVADGNGHQR